MKTNDQEYTLMFCADLHAAVEKHGQRLADCPILAELTDQVRVAIDDALCAAFSGPEAFDKV